MLRQHRQLSLLVKMRRPQTFRPVCLVMSHIMKYRKMARDHT